MKKLDLFWMSNPEWCYWDEHLNKKLKDDAPKEAKESYKKFLEQRKKGIK